MARINTNAEVWSEVSEFGGIRDVDAGFTETLDSAAAKGATSVDVATDPATGGLAAGDYLRVGADNDLEVHVVSAISGTGPFTIELETALIRDHAAGEEVAEQELVNYGAVADDGVNVDHSGTQNEIRASTQANIYVTLLQEVSANISCNLLNWSPENLAAAMGIPESEVTGTGADADPYQVGVTGENVASVQNYSLYLRGARNDGSTFEIIGFDAAFDPNVARNLLRGQQTNLPVAADVNGGVVFRLVTA